MYDPRQEAHEFVADSRAEAVSKAAAFYSCDEGELQVSELPETLAGAAGRVVVVAVPAGVERPRRRDDDGDRREGRGGRGRGRDRNDRGDRDRGGRGRGRRREEPRREEREARREEPRREEREDRDEERRDDREEPAEAPELAAPSEPSVGTAVGEIQEIGKFILGAVERMDLGPFEIHESEEAQYVIYQLNGPAAASLASGEGKAGDALQLIANQAAMRLDEEHKRVVVDIEGDRERREQFLARVADRAGRRARDTGRAVALDPMNGKDRRCIHLALRDAEAVATMSVGEGRYRQVVVVPEGAAEYEEAVAAMEAAASGAGG